MASHGKSLGASLARGKGLKVECTLTINRPVAEVYSFWRDFENLPRFIAHLKSVRLLDEVRSHWVLVATAGNVIEWDATINHEIPSELIAWSSVPDAEVKVSGAVHLHPAPLGRGTQLRVVLTYDSPAGKLSRLLARLLGEDPSVQLRSDLRRGKALLETGEIPTTQGQPSGRWEAPRQATPLDLSTPTPSGAGNAAVSAPGRLS